MTTGETSGRVAVITGGFGALGQVVAAAAIQHGFEAAVLGHTAEPPAGITGTLGLNAFLLGGVDLADEAAAVKAMKAVMSRFGRIDALLNIAGGFRWIKIEDSHSADIEFLFRMNVQTTANAIRAALPALKKSPAGRIVNVGALAAEKATAGMGPYAASKAAVLRLTEALAEELKDGNVTVNAVLPSIIDTAQNRADMPKADFSRWVAPVDLAEVMLFLASEKARAVTGASVAVRGRV
ncbi:MAG TPA: SDR family NAD(P)-dependent oxidoreductase [Micropepsaceae bacterium]|nr:SDR family NAD(P)-dependent oxidoreductase [Micropepsaceae bacterium]